MSGRARPASTRHAVVPLKPKRLKLRAREHARLQCQNLELDILNLQQEIATLTTTRRLLYARTFNRADEHVTGSFVKTILEYYDLARFGYYNTVWRDAEKQTRPIDFRYFMRAVFDDALAIGDGEPQHDGRELYMADLEEKMVHAGEILVEVLQPAVKRDKEYDEVVTIEVSTKCSCAVTAASLDWVFPCSCAVTAASLDWVFPHVRAFPWLREKLIGQPIELFGCAKYTFCVRTGRVIRANLLVNPAPAILALAETDAEYDILTGVARCAKESAEEYTQGALGAQSPDEGSSHTSSPRMELSYLLASENGPD